MYQELCTTDTPQSAQIATSLRSYRRNLYPKRLFAGWSEGRKRFQYAIQVHIRSITLEGQWRCRHTHDRDTVRRVATRPTCLHRSNIHIAHVLREIRVHYRHRIIVMWNCGVANIEQMQAEGCCVSALLCVHFRPNNSPSTTIR